MRIVGTLVALGVWMTPVMVTVAEQPSWAQSQQPSAEEIKTEIQQLIEQATQLQKQGEYQQSIEIFQQVLAISQKSKIGGIEGIESMAWLGIGHSYYDLGQRQVALESYEKALLILRPVLPFLHLLRERRIEATILVHLGLAHNNMGKPQEAIEYYEKSLSIFQEVQDRGGTASTLNFLGSVYEDIRRSQEAIEHYQKALSIFQEVQNWGEVAMTLNLLALAYKKIGKPQEAIEHYQKSLSIFQEMKNRGGTATTFNLLGSVYEEIGKPQEAIEYYQEALLLFQGVQNRGGEAGTLSNLGAVYDYIGKPQEAIEYLRQALPLHREVQDLEQEVITLNNLGLVYSNIGKQLFAIVCYQEALLLLQEVQDQEGQAATLHNLGSFYNNIGLLQQAIEYYQEALLLFQEVKNREGEAATLTGLGLVHHRIGGLQQAIEYYKQALSLFQARQHQWGEARVLDNIAAFYRDTNQPEKAIEHWKQSLEIILNLRSNLKQEHRKTFIESNDAAAIALTSLLIQQNEPKEAFTWINRVTTYELADYTRLLGAKVENPQAQALIDEYNQRSQQIESLRRQLQLDLSDDQLSRRINDLQTENIQLGEQIAQQFPEAADLFETPLIDIDELQATIPDGTLVLQPVPLANVNNVPDTLALFLLTRDSFQVVQTSLDVEQFNQLVQRYPEQLENRDKDSLTTSRDLYHILIRPIEDQLNAYNPQHLSIIATGQLRYIPFESLNDRETKQFLIEKYPINYLTRLSPTPSNPQTRNNSRRLLAFGNPKPGTPLDLPGTEAEVNTITRLFRNSQRYLHQSATLDQFKTQAPKFPFLHLATHGCFQDQPCQFESEKNGKIDTATLAANTILFADRQWPIQDAALLGLTDTRLIALSACQTAREADLEGNSISGVAYLFERAGAQAVMASLWQAEDRYTQELMSDFYQYITEGMTQAQALRQAKLNQLKHHPHIWSPFILIGDAQSDPLPETGFLSPVRTPVFALIAGSILLIGGFCWLKRGR